MKKPPKNILKHHKEFIRSLGAYVEAEMIHREQLKEINKKFLFFREIAGIETLVMDIDRKV